MTKLLTTKDVQAILHVDRSTIYRMAEAGQLPAVKVGKQWRFPSNQIDSWLHNQGPTSKPSPPTTSLTEANGGLENLLPVDCIQLIQDAFAEALNVMLLIADLDGQPITTPSHPCDLYNLVTQTEIGREICHQTWRELAAVPTLEPRLIPGFGGILSARALVRLGNELKGMVIVTGISPETWPPEPDAVKKLAVQLDVDPDTLQTALAGVYKLTPAGQKNVLITVQRIADIVAHISHERQALLDRLSRISRLSTI